MKKILMIISLITILMLTVSCTSEEAYDEVQSDPALEIEQGVGIQVVEGEDYTYEDEDITATATESYSWCLEAQATTQEGVISSEIVTDFQDYLEEFCHIYTVLNDGRYSHTYWNEDHSVSELTIYLENGEIEGRTVQDSTGTFVYGPNNELIYSSN